MAHSEQQWKEAKKKCKLSEADIRIAKEMGLNPRSLIKNIPSKQQSWKLPVKEWLWDLWEDRQMRATQKKLNKQTSQEPIEGNKDNT